MPASRIVFALVDVTNEFRRLTSRGDEDGPAPTVEVHVDASTFRAAIGVLEDHVGQPLRRERTRAGDAVRFQGLLLVAIPGPD